jgi:hypothetical protein
MKWPWGNPTRPAVTADACDAEPPQIFTSSHEKTRSASEAEWHHFHGYRGVMLMSFQVWLRLQGVRLKSKLANGAISRVVTGGTRTCGHVPPGNKKWPRRSGRGHFQGYLLCSKPGGLEAIGCPLSQFHNPHRLPVMGGWFGSLCRYRIQEAVHFCGIVL